MLYTSIFTTLVASFAMVGAVAVEPRQEAARFGVVNIDASSLSTGQTFEITYNSTLAIYDPVNVDFYLQGHRPNGDPTPYVSLSRHDYSTGQTILTSTETTPDLTIFGEVLGWGLWAFITYPYNEDGLKLYGGTSAGFPYQ